MPAPRKPQPEPCATSRDDSTAARGDATKRLFLQGRRLWPRLERLDSVRRSNGAARGVLALAPAMAILLDLLATPPSDTPDATPEDTEAHGRWSFLRTMFDGGVKSTVEGGGDWVEHVRGKVEVIRTCQSIADALDGMAREFRDHALATASDIAAPVERSLDLARTLYRGDYASELGDVMDALRALTAPARRSTAAAAKENEAKPAESKADDKPANDKPAASDKPAA